MKSFDIANDDQNNTLKNILFKSFQSCNINFLLGGGTSSPTISTAVSYIDKITEESIPTLPVGTCIFNGISTQMPIKIVIDKLSDDKAPHSDNLYISNLI